MNNIYNLIASAHELRKETQLGSISPERVGSILEDTCKYLNEAQIFADALIQKVYATEEAFNNDTERLSDLTGKPMKAGSIIYIRSNDTFYRYDGGNTKTDLKENALDQLLSVKADKDGVYPDLTAGDLAGRGESVPAEFGFRASGGKSIKDGRAYIKRIKGNSVVWNQLYPTNWSKVAEGITSTSVNGKISAIGTTTETYFRFETFVDNIADHKYLFMLSGASKTLNGKRFGLLNIQGLGQATISNGFAYAFYTNTNASGQRGIGIQDLAEGTEINESLYINQIDLTKAFPNDWENINTIEDFNARVATLGVDMNAYNEGEVIHCNTESIKSVGDNAWDEEWRNGHYSALSGMFNGVSKLVANVNPIKILPNSTYVFNKSIGKYFESYAFFYDDKMNFILYKGMGSGMFTSPSNAVYMNFYIGDSEYGSVYNHDFTISLYHSGWKAEVDNTYKPYWQDTLPLPIIRKYFPQGMKSAGSAHDEIRYNKASGKWEYSRGKIKSVDMGEMPLSYNASDAVFNFALSDIKQPTSYAEREQGAICSRYIMKGTSLVAMPDKSMMRFPGGLIYIKDSSYTDVASFKAAMAGVILYYESNDWEWVELDAEDQNFRDYYNVADFGTEQSQSSVPSAPFSADIIYQFNAVDMIREHELEITELQSSIATMRAQIDSLINNTEAEEQ